MTDTGFFVSKAARRRAATMYKLDDDNRLRHDVMGPPRISLPRFCAGGGGLWSTADEYLKFVRMMLRDGEFDGTRVLSAESVRLMCTDRLTAEQKKHPFLGAPYCVDRGFGLGLPVVTEPAKSAPLFGPGGSRHVELARGCTGRGGRPIPTRDLMLIYLVQNHPYQQADVAAAVRATRRGPRC
jgi:CubicO group peptidase (beta-lactamase class C family)